MEKYIVKPVKRNMQLEIEVPGSKSITNRALLLAALADGTSKISNILFSDDSRHFLQCLVDLGFEVEVNEAEKTAIIKGENGIIPRKEAEIYVGSAGTAARFLTAMTGLAGGKYIINASEQMKKRPMKELFEAMMDMGIKVEYLEEKEHLPVIVQKGSCIKNKTEVDIGNSSQFLSALLMAAAMCDDGLEVKLTGNRKARSYIDITVNMMRQFGAEVDNTDKNIFIMEKGLKYNAKDYYVEPDISAACYFYAMAAITGSTVTVKNVHFSSMQGDIKFLKVLEKLGCKVNDTPVGIEVRGTSDGIYNGIEIDMSDFSDQTMTMAAVAVFAQTPTVINNIAHIRHQESDRIKAIVTELSRMGIRCEEREDGLTIYPSKPQPAIIQTYNDHRMAMAFSLIGLVADGIEIDNPKCCAKTFENYFDILNDIISKNRI